MASFLQQRNFEHSQGRQGQQQQQQQRQQKPQQSIPFRNFVPIDDQISPPISLPNAASFPDPPRPSIVNVMGLAPGATVAAHGWEPRTKRHKEQDSLGNSQIRSIDFLQTGPVSTGLGLSLDNRRVAVSSGESPRLLLQVVDEDIDRELQGMEAEMDRFIKIEVPMFVAAGNKSGRSVYLNDYAYPFKGDRLRQSISEKVQAKQFEALALLEDKIIKKIREKDSELENINKKNMDLEEQMKQLSVEVGAWQQRAKYNENLINSLKYNLEQLSAQNRDNEEGCDDSEVDHTASCCNNDVSLQHMLKQNRNLKEAACKVCRVKEPCMLLLPCRHLCLCKDCESKLSFCPLCRSSKFIGIEVYL